MTRCANLGDFGYEEMVYWGHNQLGKRTDNAWQDVEGSR